MGWVGVYEGVGKEEMGWEEVEKLSNGVSYALSEKKGPEGSILGVGVLYILGLYMEIWAFFWFFGGGG